MRRHFDTELKDLKNGLLAMAGQVEEMIALTCQALAERSDAKADRVSTLDRLVDEQKLRLDQACIDLLALQAPLASDLRFIASSIKLIPELERIGDHCCNIARRSKLLSPQPSILRSDSLDRLGSETQSMVRRAVDAFVNGDREMARSVIRDDEGVNGVYGDIYRELVRLMMADPLCVERATHLIIVIKNWERIADQATNIAEEVLFILEGVNVKHPHLQQASES